MPQPSSALPAGLGDNLGWLLAQCLRAHRAAMDRAVADFPHGHRGLQALAGAVHRCARNQAELARQLGVDRTVMVYLVDDLEHAGLVERIPDPADRRSRLIRATETGQARLAATQTAINAAEAELLAALSDADQARLRAMLREIAAHQIGSGCPGNPCDLAVQITELP
ncbi:MAG TPA: MarR family winged helix-turn-helix transcriptional regulator [Mycobacteriales bacterium]|nr:MarR family winged helix-turn-helix transcriptional regulator [Mycobacteriales bacterium]